MYRELLNPENKIGEWIFDDEERFICSICDFKTTEEHEEFSSICPFCGSKMIPFSYLVEYEEEE